MFAFDTVIEQYDLWRLRRKFYRCHGTHCDLESPRSYSEKIFWRKVFDRNPLFPLLTDKYGCREYAERKLGKQRAEEILVPLLFVTESPGEIPFDTLPGEYIVKPNHGSGWSIRVDSSHPAQPGEIISKCRTWLRSTYGKSWMEWAYQEIQPVILIEKLLKDREGRIPTDFKFIVFDGKVEAVYVYYDRFGQPTEAYFDREFKRLPVGSSCRKDAEVTEKPQNFEEMLDIAEALASGVDFLRVDLYNVDGRIFFGEFTLYPASGLYRYEPTSFDFELGRKWILDKKHERRFSPWLSRI